LKVYLGPYSHWFQPARWYKDWVLWRHGFGYDADYEKVDIDKLDKLTAKIHDSWIYDRLWDIESWIDQRAVRKVQIKIHDYDVWSMDSTLSLIILPMLKLLKEKKQGSPLVDDEDVPEELRSTSAPALTEEEQRWGHVDANLHARWEWVLNEMIWAFENQDSEADAHFFEKSKPFDRAGYTAWQERKTRGFTLFGKYFEGLWD
jgi:hypothetical protein